jgi:hypothetical protein
VNRHDLSLPAAGCRKSPRRSGLIEGSSALHRCIVAVQCSATRCNVVQCGAMRCNAVQCGAMRCNVVQCGAMWCNAVQCPPRWARFGDLSSFGMGPGRQMRRSKRVPLFSSRGSHFLAEGRCNKVSCSYFARFKGTRAPPMVKRHSIPFFQLRSFKGLIDSKHRFTWVKR